MGDVYLTDFGLAKATTTGSKYTRTGQALGTPAYMSPEQARGETAALTPATDVWALGCVLYELLAGRRAFGGDTPAEVIGAVLTSAPAPIRRVRPDVPSALDAVLRVALARRRVVRYPSARVLADELHAVLAGRRPTALVRRRRRRAGAAVVTVVVAAAGALALPLALRRPALEPPAVASAPALGPADALAARAQAALVGDPERAAAGFAEALQLAPGRSEWRIARGLACLGAGQPEEARAEWARVPPEAPEWSRARLHLGFERLLDLRSEEARLDEAEADLRAAATSAGAVGILAKAGLAIAAQQNARAIELLGDLPGWEAAAMRGYALMLGGPDWPEAPIRHLTQALAEGPEIPWILAVRGMLLTQRGDWAAAEADASRAIRRVPRNESARIALAAVCRARGDHRGALEHLRIVAAKQADNASYMDSLGTTYANLGEFATAIGWHTAALERGRIYPTAPITRATILYHRGNARQKAGDDRGAEVDYTAALALEPALTSARSNRGSVRLRLGDIVGACDDLEAVARADGASARAWFNLGNAFHRARRLADAVAAYDRALGLEAEQLDCEQNRAAVLMEMGDAAGARAVFERLVARDPADAGAWQNLAIACDRLQDDPAAAKALREWLRVAPDDRQAPKGRVMLAQIEARLAAK